MDTTAYLPLAAAAGLQRALDVTSNNLANGATAGYRASRLVFEDLLHSADPARVPVAMPQPRLSYTDTRAGSLSTTGNPLDLALGGEGLFAFALPDGRTGYGRAAQLVRDAEGQLVTASGLPILDDGGAPVVLPQESGLPVVGRDGTVSDREGALIARIGVFTAPALATWERSGESLFVPRDGADEPGVLEAPQVIQGALEASNVNPITEMVRLIEIQRAFEQAMSVGRNHDELRRAALSKLGQRA
ncbi:flagellar hook-basal body protein [Falsigemmobacter faecalis]|uniref:Flagellar hook basal-body protein n=1 Tax=Falsigemmobacter faecalis TaxID=2488730 RepID=A0A3P3DNG7_9RHOB|nr:flagellar hook basal-body protein [Falsigemmobacter faecalis]RRH75783.1 flagellar hook basal-body protein [Falsigemmobacter faecalis]